MKINLIKWSGAGSLLLFLLLSCLSAPSDPTQLYWISTPKRIIETQKLDQDKLDGFYLPARPLSTPYHLVNLEKYPLYSSLVLKPQKLGAPQAQFMSNHFEEWKEILTTNSLGKKLVLLQKLALSTKDFPENFWASNFLYSLYFQANIPRKAAHWLQVSLKYYANSEAYVRLAWLELFELNKNPEKVQIIFQNADPMTLSPSGKMLYQLVRLNLNYHKLSLDKIGIDSHISDLKIDQDDLWISTWDGGLARYSIPTKTWKVFWKTKAEVSPIKLLCLTKWFVYVFQDTQFSRYSKVTETWRTFSYPVGWGGLRVESVVPLGEENLLLANLGRGLWEWKEGQWTDLSQALPSLYVTAMSPASQGGWWIGTQDAGGGWLSQDYQRFSPWLKGPKDVTFILDHQGYLFAGSYGQGLWEGLPSALRRLSNSPSYVVIGLLQSLPQKSSLNSDSVVLWGGSLDHGSFRWDGKTWTTYSSNEGFPFTDVTSLAFDGSSIWWGSRNDGVGAWRD